VEIATRQGADGFELVVSGRLDAYWADHLSRALDDAVRGGTHHLRLDMSDVPYMSSVGIRVLLRFYKETQRIGGSFAIRQPSVAVRGVLELAGLESLLSAGGVAAEPQPAATTPSRRLDRENATIDVFDLAATASARCRVVGEGASLEGCRYRVSHPVRFPAASFGVGVGAFGSGFDDCRSRFGEFLAVAGAAAYLPTDGTNVPDVVVATKDLVPELQVLHALVCEGGFASLARFEAAADDAVTLSELVGDCLSIAGTDAAGIVMVAETTGLLGAALRRSPAASSPSLAEQGGCAAPFAFPGIRDWLSFTPERAFARSLVVVAGIATRCDVAALRELIRPLGPGDWPAGHFHAAAFPYRALAKGRIDLAATIEPLFSGETIQGVLHLLGDDRPAAGAGQSEFLRGACWIAPIGDIVAGEVAR
jgi:anti-anti-sigma factor